MRDIQRPPVEGTGKPEALTHALWGYWSRRISKGHRMVSKVTADALPMAQLRYHS
ncbi:MAG: Txe/YoeB family addiction module toxin [Desulfacinum sp.]|nr:Txe/YoeB family addiction module toxin [Desulfacinum sp.]